ncbi:site-specific DNA-methyltransferase [Klebsiella aerogenes]|uniref:site-specific DNA-methyltransferase n=2 Tax=Klebsiella aerogenes TaxID=548 RepID=UPI0006692F21|nr:site-specific DNA-methyltransferase [Klebsiella aerogenes]
MSKYNELVKKLKEIFQIDRPELDFGIYRILNARADEINDYLENKLKIKIQSALADAENANKADLEQQLHLAIKAATDAGFESDESPKVQEIQKKLSTITSGASEHENAVFSHLLTFFSRYYDNGDFISKRRYKGNTYAIPYAGEEVMLHWANKDQYYIKSGENFANYSFKLADGRKVSFQLLAADTAKDNRKDNDLDRCFILIEPHVRTKFDDEGEEYEQEYKPVEVIKTSSIVDGKSVDTEELIIHFEYKAMKKGTKQETLVQSAISKILSDNNVQQHWVDLAKRVPTEKNPMRTELERHLTTYTQRNTADYFIHKDLGGFLTNELDFYIKNEVMNLDNLQNAEVFSNIEKQLRMIQCLRSVSLELIAFLAQVENLQKKLWNKKKFVVSTDFYITMDKINPEFHNEIVNNEKIIKEWIALGFIDPHTSKSDLVSLKYATVNISYLNANLKNKILSNINNIDDNVNGIFINGDNYQALNILKTTYNSRINCVHIDPPYNTDTSGFLYKNSFRHSSWLSMMDSRLNFVKSLLSEDGVFFCHIDENEYERLYLINRQLGLIDAGTIIWDKRNPMNGGSGIAIQHEYITCFTKNAIAINKQNDNVLDILEYAKKIKDKYPTIDNVAKKEFSDWVTKNKTLTGGEQAYKYIDEEGRVYQSVSLRAPEPRTDKKFHEPLIHPVTGKPCAIPPNGFSRTPETLKKMMENGDILFGVDETTQPRQKAYLHAEAKKQITSVIQDAKKGKSQTTQLGIDFPYCHSTSLYNNLIGSASHEKNEIILDFFAGSGTSGHSVIELNRKDMGSRKYILIEQGEYAQSVTLSRLRKVVFSSNWKDGKALDCTSGSSHILKVMKLESYEDSLNNIKLVRQRQIEDLFNTTDKAEVGNEYLINYMLESESKGSRLNTDNFKRPFDYEMDIAMDSAGSTERKNIDLVETFNYLIGLHVKSIESDIVRGYVRIEGTLPTGERTLILWRDCDKIGYEELNKYANRFDLYAKEKTFDVIYINGDHNLPTAFTVDEEDGEIVRSLKIRQIEPEFLNLMFAEEV